MDILIVTKGRKVIIQVSDYGIGIDPSEIPHLFSKFYRSKGAKTMDTEGFGLALFLSKSIVERHGGKIEAISEGIDRGATFKVILKRVK